MPLTSELEQHDGRWIADVSQLPGVLAYGQTAQETITRVQARSLRVLADWLEPGEGVPNISGVFAVIP